MRPLPVFLPVRPLAEGAARERLALAARSGPATERAAGAIARAAVAAARADAVRAEPAPLRFDAAGKHYTAKTGTPVHALADIDLTVNAGEICGIIGRSGAGKSTLLRLINRLETPSSGAVRVQGVDIATLDEEALVQLRRRVGMIFQHFNLLSAKTVWENIALPLRVTGMARAAIEQRVADVLALVGLLDKRNAYPAQLSGGQKQRVGIARALVHGPGILLSDEATSALDPETTAAILALLRDINRRLGLTIVLITHEMSVIRAICDTVVVLDQGRIVERGRVAEVFGAPRHPVTQALLAPLMHELPASLLAELRAAPPADPAAATDMVLSLRYTGQEGQPPDLAAIGRAAAGRAANGRAANGQDEEGHAAEDQAPGGALQLLHANLDHLQDQVVGRLVLKLRGSAGSLPGQLAALRRVHANLEVLGYVQPTV